MVDELVLGLEGLLLPGALLPVAGVVCVLRATDVVHGQVVHNVVEGVEEPAAGYLGVLVHPQAGHLLLDGGAHVAVVGGHVPVAHVPVVVAGGPHVVEAEGVVARGRSVQAGGEHRVGGVHLPPEE